MLNGVAATRTDQDNWDITWPVGTSPYSVWLDGKELASGLTEEAYSYTGGVYIEDAPPVEVLEAGDPTESELYPPFFVLQWRGLVAAAGYVVEQFVDAAWEEQTQITERGDGYYSWESDLLTDGDSHQFRVSATDDLGNLGTSIPFTSTIMRNPAPPEVSLAIVAGDVVVSAA